MFSQLFFKKNLREKPKALKDNALRPEKIFNFFSVDNTAKVGNAKNMAKTCGGIFSGFMPKNMVSEGKLGAKGCYRVIIYIWAELSQRDCGPHFAAK